MAYNFDGFGIKKSQYFFHLPNYIDSTFFSGTHVDNNNCFQYTISKNLLKIFIYLTVYVVPTICLALEVKRSEEFWSPGAWVKHIVGTPKVIVRIALRLCDSNYYCRSEPPKRLRGATGRL